MTEWKLFADGVIPEYTTPEWYKDREHAPHLDQDGHKERIIVAASWIKEIEADHRIKTVIDLGAGDGGLLSLLGNMPKLGFDLMPANVSYAKDIRGENVSLRDVVADPPSEIIGAAAAPILIVVTEILEHLVSPHEYIRRLVSYGAEFILASSPWHETDQQHYPFHTWAWDTNGYNDLIESNGFSVLRQDIVGGAQLILGRACL